MKTNDQLRAVMTSKIDEGTAGVRELVRRSGEESLLVYFRKLNDRQTSNDPDEMLLSSLAILGLATGYLSFLNQELET